ncbi:VCBS repeat-containing protein [Ascidiimonas aurantiaca]|uniref:VCBS repeat-containing protein n=1 Tax=Ascidiimonas aurantiaca TaxID=1685432 RepID=UPI0030EEFFF1
MALLLVTSACTPSEEMLFESLHPQNSGVTFENTLTHTPELNILTYLYFYNGAGVAVADFTNDGLADVYFTANMEADKLFVNKGDLRFEEVTRSAGIQNADGWTTGVTHVDINHDGLLDIYICKVSDFLSLKGHNLLYVNQGVNQQGVPVFKESAAVYGLDFSGLSTQASFFDYDLDGDLDLYLLNHSVHPNRNYGKGKNREIPDWRSGDKLFRNDQGKFTEVTQNSGIFQGKIGYGLGVSISDINNDRYPDIYVGNDFFENDYLYINQQNGTFKEVSHEDLTILGHTTHYSMGNDIADINNDGHTDIISLDMLPEELHTYKTSGAELPFQTYAQYLKNGYAPQFMQNTLHINRGNGMFSEIAFAAGVAATEWSWAPLLADLDNDGYKDIFITNGIKGASNDMDYINFIANNNIQRRIANELKPQDMGMIDELPEKKVINYFFKNNKNGTYSNQQGKWLKNIPSYSNGSAYADLDNDGDLDLVVNNVNAPAFVLENKSTQRFPQHNHLTISFNGNDQNPFGIGTSVTVYSGKELLLQENFVSRGYLSSVPPEVHFGLGNLTKIDSIHIQWPDGRFQSLLTPQVNQKIEVFYKNATLYPHPVKKNTTSPILENTHSLLSFTHKEHPSIEFNRDPLIPFAYTNEGPGIAIGDSNLDKKDDIFICGAKMQSSALFIQDTHGNFIPEQSALFAEDSISEDIAAVFTDIDTDGDQDLIVVSGGNEFKTGAPLTPRLYINDKGVYKKDTLSFTNTYINASSVKAVDFNTDGYPDLCITSNQLPWQYGQSPKQYLFENNQNGTFSDVSDSFGTEFQNIGNVQDIIWTDLNSDNKPDAVAVGHWMPVSVFLNRGDRLILQKQNSLNDTHGWWNTVQVADIDNDGDLDLIAGNWGLNTRIKASREQPVTLYRNDFDDNGKTEPVITYFYQDQETLFASKDDLARQMPFLNKKYLSYAHFADAAFKDIFPIEKIQNAYKKQVFELASCYFENTGNLTFKKQPLPFSAQLSPVQDIYIGNFNNNGYSDIFLVGNHYEINTLLGRQDASHGILLTYNSQGFFTEYEQQKFYVKGAARQIGKIRIGHTDYLVITINDNTPVFLKINNRTPDEF